MNEQKALKQIALVKTGCTIEQIKPVYGDFEEWFAQGLGVEALLQVDVFRGEQIPAPDTLAGVVITGSPAMVSARHAWSENTARWLRRAVKAGLPILGVCYGHQLLAHALGGQVGPNPAGRQIGTVATHLIEYNKKDTLLGHLSSTFMAQASHAEVVLELPPGARRLATSPLDDNFAIRFGKSVWGVQFHPEFSAAVTSQYIHYRSEELLNEGLDPEALQGSVKDTKESTSVLQKFASLIRKRNE